MYVAWEMYVWQHYEFVDLCLLQNSGMSKKIFFSTLDQYKVFRRRNHTTPGSEHLLHLDLSWS